MAVSNFYHRKKTFNTLFFDEYLLSFQTDSNNVYSRIWKTPSERTIGELREPNLNNKRRCKKPTSVQSRTNSTICSPT